MSFKYLNVVFILFGINFFQIKKYYMLNMRIDEFKFVWVAFTLVYTVLKFFSYIGFKSKT